MYPGSRYNRIALIFTAVIIVAGGFFVFQKNAQAAPGIYKTINFQGKVVNTDGTNVANGNYDFVFRIYTQQAPGGAAVWTETRNGGNQVAVNDGIFQVNLGSITALPGSVDFNTDNIYLSIEFTGNGEMTPRIQFTASPYAFQADNSNTLQGATWGSPGAIGATTPNSASFTTMNSSGASQIATAGGAVGIGNTAGTVIITSGGTSSWANTSGNLTVSTVTSGTLALSSAGALNLSGSGASYFNTSSGNISFQIAGTGTIGTLQIGVGGAGSTAPDYLGLDVKSTTGDPAGGFEGAMYYNTSDNKFRCYQGTGWTDCIGGTGSGMSNPMTTSGDIIYGGASGSPLALAGSTVDGYVLKYNTSTSAPYWSTDLQGAGSVGIGTTVTGATSGSVFFAGTDGILQQDNANFFWDDSTNRLGIGTTNPGVAYGSLLHLYKNDTTSSNLLIENAGNGANSYAEFILKSDSGVADFFKNSSTNNQYGGTGSLNFGTVSAENVGIITNNSLKVLISSGGNVGIGKTNPGYKLDVNGTLGVGSTAYFASNIGIGTSTPAYGLEIVGTFKMSTTQPVFGSSIITIPASSGTMALTSDLHNAVTLGANQNGLSLATQVLSMGTASSTSTGALTSGDWGIFNGKQAGSSNLTSLSGLSYVSNAFVKMTGANTFSLDTTAYLSDGSVYALLAGRAGGQTLIGGTAANNTLVHQGTSASGNTATNVSQLFKVGDAGETNAMAILNNGSVGIGLTNPTYALDIVGTFHMSTTAPVFGSAILTVAGTGSISGTNTGDQFTSTSASVLLGRGSAGGAGAAQEITLGTGLSMSGTTLNASGGGMSNPMSTSGDIIYGLDGGTPQRLAGGSNGYVLSYNTSTSAPQWTAPGAASVSIGSNISGGTAGSVLFIDGSGNLGGNASEFFWNDTLHHLGIGTTAVSGAAFTVNEEVGSENLIQLKQNGMNKMVVNNYGGMTVNASNANVTKNSTGDVNNPTDFEYTGAGGTAPQLYNVSAAQNAIVLNDGALAFNTAASTVATSAAVGAGAHSIVRDDGKILVIHGNSTRTMSLWDGSSATMSGINITVPTVSVGSISLRRPNGRYLLIPGGGTATTVYDPWGIAPGLAGPTLTGCSAAAGTNAFLRPDGKYQILCGGVALGVNGFYDPTLNTFTAVTGPGGAPAFGVGAHAIQRDDGTFMVFYGGGSTTHAIFNPFNNTWSGTNPITSGAPTVNTGATSVRRQDGKFLIIPGASGASTIYDPIPTAANPYGTFTSTGVGPTAALADAAQLMWRQDGKYLLMLGGGTAVNIVDPSSSTPSFTTDPQYKLPGTGLAAGGHVIVRPNGKYQVIRGGNVTTTDTVDFGLVMGGMVGAGTSAISTTGPQLAAWESECITTGDLNETSTLNWNANQEGYITFQVRTGTSCPLATTNYKDIPNSGDRISPTAGDTKIQIRAFFRRDFPEPVDQEWKMARGLSQPRYRRRTMDPMLYDVTINNSSLFHRTQFDLGAGVNNASAMDASGPASSNVNVAANGSLQLSQGIGNQLMASGTNPIGAAYAGSFGTHNALNQAAGEGSVVMKRPNGTFMMLLGAPIIFGTAPFAPSSAIAEIYDPNTQTFTNNATAAQSGSFGVTCSGTTGNTACVPHNGAAPVSVGQGSLAFKRPDGKFFIVNGRGGTTAANGTAPNGRTSIYDPVGSTFSTGPTLVGIGTGGTAPDVGRGSQAIPLPTGNVLILHGGYNRNTSIYNPVQNTMISGPTSPVVIGMGSVVVPRADGAWLVLPGSTTDTCTAIGATAYIFDPYAMTFYAHPTSVTGTGPGAFAFQRSDGMWIIMRGGATTNTCVASTGTLIYNPFTNRIAAGPNSTAVSFGAGAMQRPDGSWLIYNGNAVVTTQLYIEKDGTANAAGVPTGAFAATASMTAGTAPGLGAFNFQRDDGKYVQIGGMVGSFGTAFGGTGASMGAVSAQVVQYDAGWVTRGFYRAEQMEIPGLDANSTLSWRTAGLSSKGISAEARVSTTQSGLQSAATYDVQNGAVMNPLGTSGSWVQVNFNFKRTFPSKEGIWSDVWQGGTSVRNQTWRVIDNPTLSEFRINKDKNLLDLQSDGLSLFRVSSNGDIYTSANGSVRTGGADLAENYSSQEPLEKGEVVAIDPINDHSVKRTIHQKQPDVLGVVSSEPGFVAGSYTENSYPIALVGRVPVKVSTENGMIKAGDYLTAASVPGYAMRATVAGRVIGKALEDLNPEKLGVCPEGGYLMPDRKCGMVMMFVNLTDYAGVPVEKLMEEVKASGQDVITPQASFENGDTAPQQISAFSDYSKQSEILTFLKDLQAKEAQGPNASEILTGRLSADKEVITPQVFTDLLVAKTIKADRIEGLEFIQTGIKDAQAGVENNTFEMKSISQQIADLQGVVNAINDKTSGLTVEGPAQFKGPAIFEKVAEFIDTVIFRNDVEFEGKVTFNKDTAGYAIVKEGSDRVAITFEKEYANLPIINATLSLQQIEDPEVRKAAEDLLLVSDVKMIITNVTTKGFEIRINQLALSQIPFSWQAIAIKDAQIFESQDFVKTAEQGASLEEADSGIDVEIRTDVTVETAPSVPATTIEEIAPAENVSTSAPAESAAEVLLETTAPDIANVVTISSDGFITANQ